MSRTRTLIGSVALLAGGMIVGGTATALLPAEGRPAPHSYPTGDVLSVNDLARVHDQAFAADIQVLRSDEARLIIIGAVNGLLSDETLVRNPDGSYHFSRA